VTKRRKHKGKWLRLPSHPAWRTERDDFIIKVWGWGKLLDVTRGFALRFPRSIGAPQQYFSVKRHGSERAALLAARAARDEVFHATNEPERRNAKRRLAPYIVKPRSNNKSGITGITLDKNKHGACWVAWYHPSPGKQVRRHWSIKKYTNDGARQLAILWRADMLRSLT
jgi:hypothetical protein